MTHVQQETLQPEIMLDNIDLERFSELCKHHRYRLGQTQSVTARGLLSVSQYSKMESGRTIPRLSTIKKIAERLSFPIPLIRPLDYQSQAFMNHVLSALVFDAPTALEAFVNEHEGRFIGIHQAMLDLVFPLLSFEPSAWVDLTSLEGYFQNLQSEDATLLRLIALIHCEAHHRYHEALELYETYGLNELDHPLYKVLYHEQLFKLMTAHQCPVLAQQHYQRALEAAFEVSATRRYQFLKLKQIEHLSEESLDQAMQQLSFIKEDSLHPRNLNLFRVLAHRLFDTPIHVNDAPQPMELKDRDYYRLKRLEAVQKNDFSTLVFENVPTNALVEKALFHYHQATTIDDKLLTLKSFGLPIAYKQSDHFALRFFMEEQIKHYQATKRYKEASSIYARLISLNLKKGHALS